jgi:hypothetical protein
VKFTFRLLAIVALISVFTTQAPAYFIDETRPIIVEELRMTDANFEEAIECLRVCTRAEDRAHQGVNLIIKDPSNRIDKSRRLSLEVHHMTVADIEQVFCAFFDVKVRVEL